MPINKKNLPNTHRKFVRQFHDDQACAAFLEQLRWPDGFCCPVCQTIGVPWCQTRGRLVCAACRHQTSVTTGAILEKTRMPLTTWFDAAWHLTTVDRSLQGWVNYFHNRNSCQVMSGVRYHMEERLRTHLRRRHKVKCRRTAYICLPSNRSIWALWAL